MLSPYHCMQCKHLLAVAIAETTGRFEHAEVSPADMAALLAKAASGTGSAPAMTAAGASASSALGAE